MGDKMREEFEGAAKREQGLDLTRLPHGGYRSFATHQAWWAWQASRAALVVEMPKQYGPPSLLAHSEYWQFNRAIHECRAAIEAEGVRVKP